MERVNYWQTKVFKLWPHRILKLYRSDHQLYMVKDVRGILHYLLNYLSFFPIFPYFSNTKSVIFIDNLCNFICEIIENQSSGIFHPQNARHTSIVEIIRNVRMAKGKKTLVIHGFDWIIRVLMKLSHKVERAFANGLL